MSITVEVLGAARTVAGSMHLVHTEHARVLLDRGLNEGRRTESYARNENLPVRPADVDVVVLSHAHIDHSGGPPEAREERVPRSDLRDRGDPGHVGNMKPLPKATAPRSIRRLPTYSETDAP